MVLFNRLLHRLLNRRFNRLYPRLCPRLYPSVYPSVYPRVYPSLFPSSFWKTPKLIFDIVLFVVQKWIMQRINFTPNYLKLHFGGISGLREYQGPSFQSQQSGIDRFSDRFDVRLLLKALSVVVIFRSLKMTSSLLVLPLQKFHYSLGIY